MGGTVDEQQSSRGSSVLVDNVRWQGFLSTMTKAEATIMDVDLKTRRSYVRFGVSKQNYGPAFGDNWFTRMEGGVLRAHNFKDCRKPAKETNNWRSRNGQ